MSTHGYWYCLYGDDEKGYIASICHAGAPSRSVSTDRHPTMQDACKDADSIIASLDYSWVRERYGESTITQLQSATRSYCHYEPITQILYDLIAERRTTRAQRKAKTA